MTIDCDARKCYELNICLVLYHIDHKLSCRRISALRTSCLFFALCSPETKRDSVLKGVHPIFVELVLEIAVDRLTKTHDQTFEVVSKSNRQQVPAVQPRAYLINGWPNYVKSA